ncbi:MAG: helix-turn-helix domain-containing protein [Lewinellaceae bacterium]|nr:helix-turn-helix domain-containing protein [Lewinellaceae bacterium]
MKFLEQLKQLERLDQLIRLKATGTPQELANKFSISERTIYNLLEILKSFGAQIEYCRRRQSFYYANEIKFRFNIVVHPEKAKKISGGKIFLAKKYSLQFFCRQCAYF